jgi:hypothetical protein
MKDLLLSFGLALVGMFMLLAAAEVIVPPFSAYKSTGELDKDAMAAYQRERERR